MCADWFYVVKAGWRIFLLRVRKVSGNVKVEHKQSAVLCYISIAELYDVVGEVLVICAEIKFIIVTH